MRMLTSFLALFITLLLAASVLASGGSTGPYTPPTPPPQQTQPAQQSTDTQQAQPTAAPAPTTADCESLTTVKTRVQCRLESHVNGNGPEESCRGLADQASCDQLDSNVEPCYNLAGTDKDRCFKQTAGFTEDADVSGQAKKDPSPVRNYIVFLLYDLQDRMESKYNQGTVSADAASNVISAIVAAKQVIFKGGSAADIKAAVATVKQDWEAAQ